MNSAVEVINSLNSEGLSIDLILAAVDLPVDTSMKMLKYIMQNKHFHQIPVISKILLFEIIWLIKPIYVQLIHGKKAQRGTKIPNLISVSLLLFCQVLSTQDESVVIHKYLQLGATDYLVRPLCKNGILNLWMHTRTKREMVG